MILLSRMTDPAALPVEPLITAVTLAELTVGPLVAATDGERAARREPARVRAAIGDLGGIGSRRLQGSSLLIP